jgi:hypothetical protein
MKNDRFETYTNAPMGGALAGQLGAAAQQAMAQDKCAEAKCEPRSREIPDGIGQLHQATDALLGKVARLGDRLMPALRGCPPPSNTSETCPFDTEIGGALGQLRLRIASACDALDSLDSRLEL